MQRKALKRSQAREEVLVEAMKECTFKPQTNEGHRRELLQQLLDAAEFSE
jgi:c-di-GMP-binding flagellar brake protein YcgR